MDSNFGSFIEISGDAVKAAATNRLENLRKSIEIKRIEWFAKAAKWTKKKWPWSEPRLLTQDEIKLRWENDDSFYSPKYYVESQWKYLIRIYETFIRMADTANSSVGGKTIYLSYEDYSLLFKEIKE